MFSVDPQASLTDIFKKDIFGKGPVPIMDNLWAQEIDADSHIRAYQQGVRGWRPPSWPASLSCCSESWG